jgi:hypothetical protein
MSKQYRNAFEDTDYELRHVAGLAIALTDMIITHNDKFTDEDRAIVAVGVALKTKAEAVLDMHQAEWRAAFPSASTNKEEAA